MSSGANSKKRTAADAGLPEDNGAAVSNEDTQCCWICLEEGPDDSGAPLVRDCSCRGSSGFAHLPCLVQYAESTLRNAQERGGAVQCSDICRGFLTCPNCNQEYQNNVKYEMTRALVACVEREVTGTGQGQELLHATALSERLFQLDGEKEVDRTEGEEIYGKLLALMDKMKDCDNISESFELDIYASMCNFDFTVGSDDSLKRAKTNIAKVRDICSAEGGGVDQMHLLEHLDAMMKDIEAKLSGKDLQCEHVKDLNFWRHKYAKFVEAMGQSDPNTIGSGVELAAALYREDCTIEATRLLLKLVKIGRQVHGPDHNCTANVVCVLTKVNERQVIVKSQKRWFKALRYEDDGSDCVLEGPLPESADDPQEEESELIPILPGKGAAVIIPSTDILPFPGTPVICHGLRLRSSSHLNGKIGDVRALDVDDGKCLVHFEEEGLEPTVVKIGNLRVLFELPEEI